MKRFWWVLLILLASCSVPVPGQSDGGETAVPAGDAAQVIDVIDGDTIDVLLNGAEYRVRYIGVDTPERGDPFDAEATALNEELVGNQTVILVKDVSETDQYGRLLRYVYLLDGTFVNAELLRQGLARRVTFPPDVAEQAQFGRLQEDARQEARGFWAAIDDSSGVCDCSGNRYNCSDFDTQAAAQACFAACQAEAGEDVHRLDGGGDGIVCESLP